MVVFVDDALCQDDPISRLQSVEYTVFRDERLRWSSRLSESTKRRRFRTNPEKYLKRAEDDYCMLIGQL